MGNNEIVSLNHVPTRNSTHSAELAAAEALNAAGVTEFFIATGDDVRELGMQLVELRRLRALADERFFSGQSDNSPPRCWPAKKLAQQLGVDQKYIYRHASEWPFTIRLPGGLLRFVANEAAAWLNKLRAKS